MALAAPTPAQVARPISDDLSARAYRNLDIGVKTRPVAIESLGQVPPSVASFLAKYRDLGSMDIWIDGLTGLPATVNTPGIPLSADKPGLPQLEQATKQFIFENAPLFGHIAPSLLKLNPDRSGPISEDGRLSFVDYDVVYRQIPIEGARLVFRVSGMKLIQFGAEGVLPSQFDSLNPLPYVSVGQARDIAFAFAGGFNPKTDELIEEGRLSFLPRSTPDGVVGRLDYPLVWTVVFRLRGTAAAWVAHVDAHSGELLEFFDGTDYAAVKGGVYESGPTTSTESTLPMPFADIRSSGGTLQQYADSAGKFTYGSTAKSYLQGSYIQINDNCGSISRQASAGSDIDFSQSSGTDCATPGVGGSGNTHAARSAYFHLNRIKEKGRGWLPSNSWLQGQLTANVNINSTCNANWNGSSVNFFRSGGGCGNTGEIAAVFLHEYGHGLDANDGRSPADKGTGEAYGDSVAMLQTHDSCIGAGFLTSNCSGYGDSCTSCSGVRDIDYAAHSSGSAHTVGGFVKNSCPSSASYVGPCGKEGHCESMVLSESLWDLANRKLISQGYDAATAWYILDRLFYLTRPTSGSGYSCQNYVASGCGASNWHQTFLAADDDDANLANGTPHAAAIYQAFSAHGIACTSASQTNYSTCSTSLTSATPSLGATAGNNSVNLSFGAVSGAASYTILRNDFSCSAGYTKIGSTSSTSYTDTAVANGFTYYYRIVALGSNAACFSRLSNCKAVTPSAGGSPTYAISGTVTESGAGLSGVTVAYSGTASGSVATGTNGSYTITGLGNGSYTITPTKSGYSFSPTSQGKTVNGANISGVDFQATAQSTDTVLTSGVPVASAVGYHEWKYFSLAVPSGATNLTFQTTGATADIDLYTRFGAKPTTSTYDCRPYTSSGNETCTQANPASGTWWAGVRGYAAGSFTITGTYTAASGTHSISGTVTTASGSPLASVTMTLGGDSSGTTSTSSSGGYSFSALPDGNYTVTPSRSGYTFTPSSRSVPLSGADATGQNFQGTATSGGDVLLSNGVPYSDSMNATTRQGTWKYYYFDLTTGDSNLNVLLSALSNDLDLYVRRGAKPTLASYDCRPYKGGTVDESCNFASPGTGRWYVGINNWDVGNGMTYDVTGSWTAGGGGGCSANTATYNATYGCPTCSAGGKSCSAPASLLNYAGNDELNNPNTLDSCTDGTSGNPHTDESIDAVTVSSTDGASCLAPGTQVTVDITAWLYGSGIDDSIALYYATNVSNPVWTLLKSWQGTAGGGQIFSHTFSLGGTAGTMQAIRAQIRYQNSSNTPCTTGSYDDHDDLVFKVQ